MHQSLGYEPVTTPKTSVHPMAAQLSNGRRLALLGLLGLCFGLARAEPAAVPALQTVARVDV